MSQGLDIHRIDLVIPGYRWLGGGKSQGFDVHGIDFVTPGYSGSTPSGLRVQLT